MKRRDWVMFGAGVAVTATVTAIVWMVSAHAERRAEEERARRVAEEERTRIGSLQERMKPVEWAVKRYYTEHGDWPQSDDLASVAGYLKDGHDGLLDPWGQPYSFEIVVYTDATTGEQKMGPVIICRTPAGEVIRYPEKFR